MNPAKYSSDRRVSVLLTALVIACMNIVFAAPANAAQNINGQVLGAGVPIANSTVTLWAASAGAPKQLAQMHTGADGRFAISATDPSENNASLYLTAQGGTPDVNKASLYFVEVPGFSAVNAKQRAVVGP